jgi:(2Fe-2S) ferredoxin
LAKFERHVFVCTNERDESAPRGSCAAKGSKDLRKLLNDKAMAAGLKGRVRINASGCLDQCEHGISVVVYPEQTWYGFVKPEDLNELVESHLVAGNPVERMELPDDCVNTPVCPHKPAKGTVQEPKERIEQAMLAEKAL